MHKSAKPWAFPSVSSRVACVRLMSRALDCEGARLKVRHVVLAQNTADSDACVKPLHAISRLRDSPAVPYIIGVGELWTFRKDLLLSGIEKRMP